MPPELEVHRVSRQLKNVLTVVSSSATKHAWVEMLARTVPVRTLFTSLVFSASGKTVVRTRQMNFTMMLMTMSSMTLAYPNWTVNPCVN